MSTSQSHTDLSVLQARQNALLGDLPPLALETRVAFPLPGGLDGAASAFNGDIEADIYARPHNPTVRALADAVNALEGGTGAVAYASGQAAIRNVFQLLAGQDTEIVASRHVFGGTVALQGVFGRFGVTFKWADATDPQSFADAITDRTRAIFVESVANPGSEIADFAGLRAVADSARLPFIVDNTTAPLLLAPRDHGADVVVYSATKYLNGFANAAAGIAVDTGRFDWRDDARYPALSAPVGASPSLAARFNEHALYRGLLAQLTVDGSILAPEKAQIIYGNLPTLPERLAAHIDHTVAVARYLNDHPAVARVHYAGLETDPHHARAKDYLPHGVAGPILVTLKGGREAAVHAIDALSGDFLHAVNIGDACCNLVSHPQTTTHRQLTSEQQAAVGITPGSLRLGLSAQKPDATIRALDRALKNAPI